MPKCRDAACARWPRRHFTMTHRQNSAARRFARAPAGERDYRAMRALFDAGRRPWPIAFLKAALQESRRAAKYDDGDIAFVAQ